MEAIRMLTSNYLINVGALSRLIAQVLKTLLTYLTSGRWNFERLFGAGGMPSSHSALVCSLAIGMARKVGFSSPEFALSLAFAAVVMYDAMGVRRSAGEQAKVINKLVFGFKFLDVRGAQEEDETRLPNPDQKKLKEFLGHTPLEVLGGALLGILIAMIVPVN